MKTRRFVTIILSVVFLSMSFTSPALASTWQFADGRSGTGEWRDGLYFNSSNTFVAKPTSAVLIDGRYYRFNDDGSVITGWYERDHTWYYYTPASIPAGQSAIGWYQVGEEWYYFDQSGKMLADTVTPDGYYVNASGAWDKRPAYSNRASVGPFVGDTGRHTVVKVPKSGWYKSVVGWHYMRKDYAVTGWQKIGEERYYFDEDGVMVTGWQEIDDGYNEKTRGCHSYYFSTGPHDGKVEGAMLKNVYVDGVHIDRYGIAAD